MPGTNDHGRMSVFLVAWIPVTKKKKLYAMHFFGWSSVLFRLIKWLPSDYVLSFWLSVALGNCFFFQNVCSMTGYIPKAHLKLFALFFLKKMYAVYD